MTLSYTRCGKKTNQNRVRKRGFPEPFRVGQAKLLLEVLEEVDHMPPDRDVEGGNRLVTDDQVRVQGRSPCDADPPAPAAGELAAKIQAIAIECSAYREFRNDEDGR